MAGTIRMVGDKDPDPPVESSAQLQTELLTLVFTDIVASTALKQQLGDRAGARVIEGHHQLVRATLRSFAGGQEIETAGDSFLIMFTTPSEAVTFALLLQARLRQFREEHKAPVADRVGIHLGEVVIRKHVVGAKPRDLYGSNVDICSRVMSLAKAGQILMSRGVFDSARQVLKGEDIEDLSQLEWLNHGPYLVQGVEQPIEICEVRETGQDAPGPPTSSEKAQRQVRSDEEQVLGWRPAVGQALPNTKWVLERKLGEGGFGEVWLGRHQAMKERRVFKFCFRADRVRSLKREMTLFRVLKERVGDHAHIVRLLDVSFDAPPFYVEMDYVHGQDLKNWCDSQGGPERVPLDAKLEIVAQIAEGLQAAHDAGIIHRDIKPGNILVAQSGARAGDDGRPDPAAAITARPLSFCAKLTDFGIGQVVSQEYLAGVTQAGFTQTLLGSETSSQTGTQLYMAPELLAGHPASTRSDIYSLGTVLYQLLMNDFRAPLTMDWWKNITDPLLREDLELCLAGHPPARYPGAGLLAQRLRALPERRSERERQEAQRVAREEAAYRRGVIRTASLAAIALLLVGSLAYVAWDRSTKARRSEASAVQQRQLAVEGERKARFLHYAAAMNLAQQIFDQNNISRLRDLLAEAREHPQRGYEYYYWQRQAHADIQTFHGHLGKVTSVAFSRDNRLLVTASEDKTAKVWDLATGRNLFTLTGHKDVVARAVFSPDGQRIATASWDGTARIWDAASGRELLPLSGHTLRVSFVAFSPDGERIVTASWDRTARIWDPEGRCLHTLTGHLAPVSSAAFSPDGRRVVTASDDRLAVVWDASSGEKLLTLEGHTTGLTWASFSPDGSRIVTTSRDAVARLWNAKTGRAETTVENAHSAAIHAAAFSPDGERILTGSADQTAVLWQAAGGELTRHLRGHLGPVTSVAFSSDGRWIATASDDQTVKLWDAQGSSQHYRLKGHAGGVASAAFSSDGRQLVTASWDKTAKLWDPITGQLIRTFQGHTQELTAVSISPDAQRIVTASKDETARIWDIHSAREQHVLRGHQGEVRSAAWSPDGQHIATTGQDRSLRLWHPDGRARLVLLAHNAPVTSVAWSPDSQRLITGGEDHLAKIWDATSGQLLLTLRGHSGPVTSVAFAAHGRQVVTGSKDKTARTWSARDGGLIRVLKGHNTEVGCVAFSPDGERVLTGGYDHVARLWETDEGREFLTLKTPGNPILCVAFSPDGGRIFTGLFHPDGRLWESASAEQVERWRAEEELVAQHLTSLEREQAARRAQRRQHPADDGIIRQWLVLGPLPLPIGQSAAEAVRLSQLPNEAGLRPRAGEPIAVEPSQLTWQLMELDGDHLDFHTLFGPAIQQSVAYAVAYIRCDREQDNVRLSVGSDDQARLYLNGQEVYQFTLPRGFVTDDDSVSGQRLRAGENVLVFKVVNGTGDWKGSVRLTAADGSRVAWRASSVPAAQ